MKFKGTAVLVVLLLILTGWVYWTDIRGRDERAQAEEDAGKVLAVDDEDIVELRLTYPDRSIAARRTGDGWEFLIPEDFEADSGQWDTVAANVTRIDRDETVAAQPTGLAQYGLMEPGIRVGVLFADGGSDEILFGNENPRGTFDYVKLASSDEVFLAATSWAGLFEKETNDLRDKTLLRFDPDTVETIEISGATRLRFRREDSGWSIVEPLETGADDPQVSALLRAIDFARATGFADPDIVDAETGLEPPQWRIVLNDADANHELLVGGQAPGDTERYYARDASRDPVFIIEGDIAGMVSEPLLEWRDRTIASFERSSVELIEISGGEDTIELHRTGSDWFADDDRAVDSSQVSAMLDALEFEQATGILDDPEPLGVYGLDEPRLQVILKDSAGSVLLDARFGADTGDGNQLYWKSAAESQVKVVSKDVFDVFDVTEDELLDPLPPAATTSP